MTFNEKIKLAANRANLNIWGWPLLFFMIFSYCWMFLFWFIAGEQGFDPGSLKEAIFSNVLMLWFVSFLWILSFRYRSVTGKSVRKRTKILLIFISVLYVLGLIAVVIVQMIRHNFMLS